MAKRKKKDVNQIAANIIGQLSGDVEPEPVADPNKNPAAVALGRLGGLKGGKARAEKLTAKKRSEIAKQASLARWKVRKDG
jgi:hypothetical protein